MPELTQALLHRDFVRQMRGVSPDPVLGQCALWIGDHAWVYRYERGDVILILHRPRTSAYRIEFSQDTPVCVIIAALDATSTT